MTLIEKIKSDFLESRKVKDTFTSKILGTLVSEGVNVGKTEGNRETTDEEMVQLVKKFKKGVLETLSLLGVKSDFSNMSHSSDPEKAIELSFEINVYDKYLPKQLTDTELEELVSEFISKNESTNIGMIMGYFKKNFDGQYMGKVLSKIAQEGLKS